MEIESSKCRKEFEDKHMSKKRKKKKVDRFVFLPDDIRVDILDILKRVPKVFLRYKAKYVCRRWFNIITNRILLDHASCILQNLLPFKTRVVDIREEEEGLQVKEQYLDINHEGRIRSWCNEFILMSDDKNLFVYNIITKEGSYLPQCNRSCGGHSGYICGLALCYDTFTGIYKVVHLFKGPPLQCEILVLRSDILTPVSSNWKKIKVPCINEMNYFEGDPVLVEGRYLHWDVWYADFLISMDVVKEEIFQTKLPGSVCHWGFVPCFVMGGKLSKIERVSREKGEIWILKDFQKKKWENLQTVTFQSFFDSFPYDLYLVSSVMSKRYIILGSRPHRRLFGCDLKDGVMKELYICNERYHHCVVLSSAPSFM